MYKRQVLEIFTVGEEHVYYVVALRTSRGYGVAVPCPSFEIAKKLAAEVLEIAGEKNV